MHEYVDTINIVYCLPVYIKKHVLLPIAHFTIRENRLLDSGFIIEKLSFHSVSLVPIVPILQSILLLFVPVYISQVTVVTSQ